MDAPGDDVTNPAPLPEAASRKPYARPALRVYGNVATLTRALASGGKADKGHGKNSKTA